MKPLIQTKRLILTWPNEDQISKFYDIIKGTEIFDNIAWDGPQDLNEYKKYWSEKIKNDPLNLALPLTYALILKDTNELIGWASLRPVNGQFEIINIGYAIATKFHGHGFATEAIECLVNESFLNRKAQRIMATIFTGNFASARVLEKCGFTLEGTLRRSAKKGDQWRDEWIYAITRRP